MSERETFRAYYFAALRTLLVDPSHGSAEAVHTAALHIARQGMRAEAEGLAPVAANDGGSHERERVIDALAELLACTRPATSNPRTLIAEVGIVGMLEEVRYAVEEIRTALHHASELSEERWSELKAARAELSALRSRASQ